MLWIHISTLWACFHYKLTHMNIAENKDLGSLPRQFNKCCFEYASKQVKQSLWFYKYQDKNQGTNMVSTPTSATRLQDCESRVSKLCATWTTQRPWYLHLSLCLRILISPHGYLCPHLLVYHNDQNIASGQHSCLERLPMTPNHEYGFHIFGPAGQTVVDTAVSEYKPQSQRG